MTVAISVLYPRQEGSTFDLPYFLTHHMPLCESRWKPRGLKACHVIRCHDDDPYSVQCIMYWESMEKWMNAALDEANSKDIFEDIVNFSNVRPVKVGGEVVKGAKEEVHTD